MLYVRRYVRPGHAHDGGGGVDPAAPGDVPVAAEVKGDGGRGGWHHVEARALAIRAGRLPGDKHGGRAEAIYEPVCEKKRGHLLLPAK